ncbi:MAG: cytochrome c nitrite reductase subunit NrfD [Vibrio sp.]
MNELITTPFHFDSLVWDWIIAVYLFLTGMSAGGVMIAIYLKRHVIVGDAAKNGIIKAAAIFAPLGIILGLTILIFHLQRPLTFWKIMIFYNPSSVMSMGVMLFQVYMLVLFAWLGVVYQDAIQDVFSSRLNAWVKTRGLVTRLLGFISRFERALETCLFILAVMLAAYTGFLLSALKTYPMLNNPALPVLFLFSSVSSGAAACLLFGVVGFKESSHSPSVAWIHRLERPVVLIELFIIIAFFAGLYFGGGEKTASVINAIGSGFWATWFWCGVIAIGMLTPLVLNYLVPKKITHNVLFITLVSGLSLIGVLMLRTFILYAGQMTVV